jgi:hypothetical protein
VCHSLCQAGHPGSTPQSVQSALQPHTPGSWAAGAQCYSATVLQRHTCRLSSQCTALQPHLEPVFRVIYTGYSQHAATNSQPAGDSTAKHPGEQGLVCRVQRCAKLSAPVTNKLEASPLRALCNALPLPLPLPQPITPTPPHPPNTTATLQAGLGRHRSLSRVRQQLLGDLAALLTGLRPLLMLDYAPVTSPLQLQQALAPLQTTWPTWTGGAVC